MQCLHHLPGPPDLALWRQPSAGWPVLYIHGATFPAALSVGYRFDGFSWADALERASFDVWGLDFPGYGASRGVGDAPPFITVDDVADQIHRAADFIINTSGYENVLLIAHSWGSLPAGLFACLQPRAVKALVLFGPIARRDGPASPPLPGWRLVSADDQYRRFIEDVPPEDQPVLSRDHFDAWAPAWLATDPTHASRTPPSVRVPNAPYNHLGAAWAGNLAYDPAMLACPTLIVRGEWDSVCDSADMAWFERTIRPELFNSATINRGTHLLHLEANRFALYAATESFFSKYTES